MTLSPKHQQELLVGSGITDGAIALRGYRTAATPEQIAELGFSPEQCLAPALVIPIHGVDAGIVGYQIKPDHPRERDGKPVKYETPAGASMRLDVCPIESIRKDLRDPSKDLWITEGVKKGDAAAVRGLCCIALMGVWNWRGSNDAGGVTELADWEAVALKGRRIYIAFDSDVMVKPQVQAALKRLAAFLRRRGAKQVIPIVPFRPGHSGKMGIDDFFVAGGTLHELQQCAEPSILAGRTIKANNRQLPDITADALDALVESNDPPTLFVRDGQLARVEYDETGTPKIKNLGPNGLRGMMARAATWVKSTEKVSTECPPPKDVVEDLMALSGWPGVPPIVSVTLCPVLSPSGTLRRDHGYDPESRFYVASPGTWPVWEGTLESARDYLIEELLGDFPFATEADRANALAMLLLPVVRPAIDGPTPLHLLDAPVQGSGKSLLAEVCLMATCGDTITTTPGTTDEEEWRKKILAALLDGRPYVWVDNVTRMVRAEALDIVLTSRYFSDRRLGLSETVTVPIRCTWIMTSNNAEISRDLVRRTCWVRIDPQVERPEERPETSYRHPDIKLWVTRNRGRIIAAICKLVESWTDAGSPAYNGHKLGSYESWCKTIGGILEHAGVSGFMGNMEQLRVSANSAETAWEGFMMRWWERFGCDGVKAGDLRETFESDSDLAGMLGNGNESSRTTRLGHLIRKRVDRICGGLKIVRSETRTAGSTTYHLIATGGLDGVYSRKNTNPSSLFESETTSKNGVSGVSGDSLSRVMRAHDAPVHACEGGGENPNKPTNPTEMNLNGAVGFGADSVNPTANPIGPDDEVVI